MSRALGRYELLRPLARGGMAEIYLARRRAAGIEKLLVVKRLRAERAGDARFLELFVKEARLSMSLAHQNIVPVFDFGRSGDQVFLAMERVEGRDLGGSLARPGAGPLPPVIAAFIAAECCQALDYAHGKRREDGAELGVVHRDVTPRNVLVSWSGEVKLTDFGIAALAGEETSRLIGTPAYMAPEQARGEAVDARADLYGLGLVLREAMTGVRARPGADRDALIDAARRGELAPWPPGCPEALVAIADRATAAAPAGRYPDARSMLEALDAFIVAERSAQPGEPPARRLAAWLAKAWAGARDEDAAAASGEIERPELLSMFDDAAIGTGTERSLAATAPGEPEEPPPSPPPSPAAQPALASASASASGAVPASAPAPAPAPAPSTSARRAPRWLAPLAVALIAAAAFLYMRAGGDRPRPAIAPDAAQVAARSTDAALDPPPQSPPMLAPADAALDPADAAAPVAPVAPLDAAIDPPRPRPRLVDAAIRPQPSQLSSRPGPDATLPPADAAPPAARVLRKVRVNARPWATFTVDGGTTQHETISTIELAPGPHRLHFSNPQLGVERDVTIEVPADRDLDHVEDLRR